MALLYSDLVQKVVNLAYLALVYEVCLHRMIKNLENNAGLFSGLFPLIAVTAFTQLPLLRRVLVKVKFILLEQ